MCELYDHKNWNRPDFLVVNLYEMSFKGKLILLPFSSSSPLEKEKPHKGGGSAGEMKDQSNSSKQLKPKLTKAERRELQEAQRAAKAAAKGVYYHSRIWF